MAVPVALVRAVAQVLATKGDRAAVARYGASVVNAVRNSKLFKTVVQQTRKVTAGDQSTDVLPDDPPLPTRTRKATKSDDPYMRKGGMYGKKTSMMKGGMYKGKMHSYVAGGKVMDTRNLKRRT